VADDATGAWVLPFELKLLEQAVAARAIPAVMTAAENRFLIECSLVVTRARKHHSPSAPDASGPYPDHVRWAVPVQRDIFGKTLTREVTMAVIVVTRLRLKDPALLDDFFTDALAAIEQAQKSDGNLGVDALADANNAWWSVTSWQERRLMQSYVRTEPHRTIQSHLTATATKRRSWTGNRTARTCRTGRRTGVTWSPTARPPSSRSRQPPIRPSGVVLCRAALCRTGMGWAGSAGLALAGLADRGRGTGSPRSTAARRRS
jgi:hypothetical protein